MNIYNLLVSLLTFGMVTPSTQPALSITEATDLVWKMNHENIYALHRVVSPEDVKEGEDANDPKVIERIEETKKYDYRRLLEKPTAASVFRTLEAATPEEQELIKTAIKGSYAEYDVPIDGSDVFLTILFFPLAMMARWQKFKEHVAKIDAQRAALQTPPAQVA